MKNRTSLAALTLAFSLVACGTTPEPSNLETTKPIGSGSQSITGMEAIVRDFGSFGKFVLSTEGKTDAEITEIVKKYNINYVNLNDDMAAQSLTTCPERMEYQYRNTWTRVGTGNYFVDGYGRPQSATRLFPFSGDGARSEYCQSQVGQVYSGNSSGLYDGGHLIGNQLGGWGYRINLVPQNRNFNRGNWLQIENAVRSCNTLPDDQENRFVYEVTLTYPDDRTNVPSNWDLYVSYRNMPEWWEYWEDYYETTDANFINTTYGGPNGTEERNDVVLFLYQRGCGSY